MAQQMAALSGTITPVTKPSANVGGTKPPATVRGPGSATQSVNVDDNMNKRLKCGKVNPVELKSHHEELRDSLIDTFSTLTQNGMTATELFELVNGAVNDALNIHDYEIKKKNNEPKSP